MNLSNLLSSSDGSSGQNMQNKFIPPHNMLQQQFPNLPSVPGLVQQQQQHMSGLPPTLQQMTSGLTSAGVVMSGVDRQRRPEGPAAKKPKL